MSATRVVTVGGRDADRRYGFRVVSGAGAGGCAGGSGVWLVGGWRGSGVGARTLTPNGWDTTRSGSPSTTASPPRSRRANRTDRPALWRQAPSRSSPGNPGAGGRRNTRVDARRSCRCQFAPSYLCPPWLSDFVLLDRGSVAARGTTEEVRTPEALEPVYGVSVRRLSDDDAVQLISGRLSMRPRRSLDDGRAVVVRSSPRLAANSVACRPPTCSSSRVSVVGRCAPPHLPTPSRASSERG